MSHQHATSNLQSSVDLSFVPPTSESLPSSHPVVTPAASQLSAAHPPLKRSRSKIEQGVDSAEADGRNLEPLFKKPRPPPLATSTNLIEFSSQATCDKSTPLPLNRSLSSTVARPGQPSGNDRKENTPSSTSVAASRASPNGRLLSIITANTSPQRDRPSIPRTISEPSRPRAHTLPLSVNKTLPKELPIAAPQLLLPRELSLSPLSSPDEVIKDALSSKLLLGGRARSMSAPSGSSQEEEAAMGLMKLKAMLAQRTAQPAAQLREDAAIGLVKLQNPPILKRSLESEDRRCKDCGQVYGAKSAGIRTELYSVAGAKRPTVAGIRPRCTSSHGADEEFADQEHQEPVLYDLENENENDDDNDPDWEPSSSQDSSNSDA